MLWTVLLLSAMAPLLLPKEHLLGWLEQASSGCEPSSSGQHLLTGSIIAHGLARLAAAAGEIGNSTHRAAAPLRAAFKLGTPSTERFEPQAVERREREAEGNAERVSTGTTPAAWLSSAAVCLGGWRLVLLLLLARPASALHLYGLDTLHPHHFGTQAHAEGEFAPSVKYGNEGSVSLRWSSETYAEGVRLRLKFWGKAWIALGVSADGHMREGGARHMRDGYNEMGYGRFFNGKGSGSVITDLLRLTRTEMLACRFYRWRLEADFECPRDDAPGRPAPQGVCPNCENPIASLAVVASWDPVLGATAATARLYSLEGYYADDVRLVGGPAALAEVASDMKLTREEGNSQLEVTLKYTSRAGECRNGQLAICRAEPTTFLIAYGKSDSWKDKHPSFATFAVQLAVAPRAELAANGVSSELAANGVSSARSGAELAANGVSSGTELAANGVSRAGAATLRGALGLPGEPGLDNSLNDSPRVAFNVVASTPPLRRGVPPPAKRATHDLGLRSRVPQGRARLKEAAGADSGSGDGGGAQLEGPSSSELEGPGSGENSLEGAPSPERGSQERQERGLDGGLDYIVGASGMMRNEDYAYDAEAAARHWERGVELGTELRSRDDDADQGSTDPFIYYRIVITSATVGCAIAVVIACVVTMVLIRRRRLRSPRARLELRRLPTAS